MTTSSNHGEIVMISVLLKSHKLVDCLYQFLHQKAVIQLVDQIQENHVFFHFFGKEHLIMVSAKCK